MHARPATLLADFFNQRALDAQLTAPSGNRASGGSVLEIMMLGLKHGDSIHIELTGDLDEFEVEALRILVTGAGSN